MACDPGYQPLEFCVLDADVPRYIQALSEYFGYQEFIPDPETLEPVPNTENRGAFAKRNIANWMESIVIQYEFRDQAGDIEVPPVDIE